MPESTPIYGIPYPCATDIISAGAFADFADAVDAAIAAVNTVGTEALNRPAVRVLAVSAVIAIAPSAIQLAIYNTVDFDNDGLANLPASTNRVTVQTAGTYLVTFFANVQSGAGTIADAAVRLLHNGTAFYRKNNGNTLLSAKVNIAGLFNAVPGDFFQADIQYFGTVGGEAFDYQLTARMVNRP